MSCLPKYWFHKYSQLQQVRSCKQPLQGISMCFDFLALSIFSFYISGHTGEQCGINGGNG